jgi:hypothetical protein
MHRDLLFPDRRIPACFILVLSNSPIVGRQCADAWRTSIEDRKEPFAALSKI